ncbi:hypothetical protein ACFPES_03110 [Paenibacillus sp. GCM10023248]|uniref:hypothetical protein n=1 Tax=unclassified Paenibacillus TaxID=185978 RepID=UPI002378216B|nr:hypothetical protein [Paenibacillus sp. MAHUQ-63]MDD9266014.1 hypothetical protein [Paenibacillus sp. MAHUQ-63]
MKNNDALNLDANPFKLAMLQNVTVTLIPFPSDEIYGTYNETTEGNYFIFLNESLQDESKYHHDLLDNTLEILMKHHNSSQKGKTKVVTASSMKLFERLKEEVKRYERVAVEAFLRSFNLKGSFE